MSFSTVSNLPSLFKKSSSFLVLRILTLMLFPFFLQACKQAPYVYNTVTDVVGDQALGADVKSPQKTPPESGFPVILLIHGGGWETNTLYDDALETTLERVAVNYVGVTVNYRLTAQRLNEQGEIDRVGTITRNPWPAQIQDVKCAVSWIRANVDNIDIFPVKINTNKIGVAGISAGGQLALMLGETSGTSLFDTTDCENDASSSVQAVVSYAGLADVESAWGVEPNLVRPMYQKLLSLHTDDSLRSTNFDDLSSNTRELLLDTSPLYFSTLGSVPVRLIHAVNDKLSPPATSLCFYEGLDPAVRDRSLLWLDRGGHTFNSGVREHADAQMLNWFDKHLRDIDIPLVCSECITPVPEDISCKTPED